MCSNCCPHIPWYDRIPSIKINLNERLFQIILKSKQVDSTSDAKRIIKEGGVKLQYWDAGKANQKTITDPNYTIEKIAKPTIIMIGKWFCRRLVYE